MTRDLGALFRRAAELQQGGHRARAEAEALYREILKVQPGHADSLHNLGVLAAQRGDDAAAMQSFRKALKANPRHAMAHLQLGIALRRAGKCSEALASIQRALASRPDFPAAFYEQGNTYGELGRFDEALASYDRALALRPEFVAALVDRGNALSDLTRHEEALASFDRALALQPAFPEALHNRGLTLAALGRLDEALESLDGVLALLPRHAGVLCDRAQVLQRLARYDEAAASASAAVELEPGNSLMHIARGDALVEIKRYADALASYDAALAADAPTTARLLCSRAVALSGMGCDAEALADCDRALILQPGYGPVRACRAVALRFLGRLDEAVQAVDEALRINPDDADALVTRGVLHRDLNQYPEALACYERALAVRPDFPNAHFLRAWAWLVTGDLRRGFEAYEWRWTDRQLAGARRRYAQPRWAGCEPLAGRTLLVYAEQGLGDTLQFCRFVPRLAEQGACVVFEVQPSIAPLLASLAGVQQLVPQGAALPEFDLHCPLLSLPLALGIDSVDAIPSAPSYLAADPATLARWRERLGPRTRRRIGLAWAGSARNVHDRSRSLSLAALLDACGPDVELFSLQKELRAADGETLQARHDVHDFADDLTDFRETAALVTCMDLVVSVDTSVAHLAGALGIPVWVLLPFAPDWRWLLAREDSPWYRSARLFRQPAPGDWSSVIRSVRAALGRPQ